MELKVKSLSVTPSDEEVLSLANKIVFKHGTPSPRKNLPGLLKQHLLALEGTIQAQVMLKTLQLIVRILKMEKQTAQ